MIYCVLCLFSFNIRQYQWQLLITEVLPWYTSSRLLNHIFLQLFYHKSAYWIHNILSWIITPTQNDLSKPDLILRSRCHLQRELIVANWKLGFRPHIEFPWITPLQWISYDNWYRPSYKLTFAGILNSFFIQKHTITL